MIRVLRNLNHMLTLLTILIVLGLAGLFVIQGLATAFTTFCNVVLAGLIAFNFWEPLADLLEPPLSRSFGNSPGSDSPIASWWRSLGKRGTPRSARLTAAWARSMVLSGSRNKADFRLQTS